MPTCTFKKLSSFYNDPNWAFSTAVYADCLADRNPKHVGFYYARKDLKEGDQFTVHLATEQLTARFALVCMLVELYAFVPYVLNTGPATHENFPVLRGAHTQNADALAHWAAVWTKANSEADIVRAFDPQFILDKHTFQTLFDNAFEIHQRANKLK